MNPDRILTAYDGDLDTFVAAGGTLAEADAALSLARLDLELERSIVAPTMRQVVGEFLRTLEPD
jgi:hypothetical protein